MSKSQEPVFPTPGHQSQSYDGTYETIITHEGKPGLTKREYFAGLALQGMLSNPEIFQDFDDLENPSEYDRRIARECVISADALLKELNKAAEA